jgi:hypothetical protein
MPDALDGDFTRSRAVLIGTWTYRDPNLHDVPAAEHSLHRMRDLLTSSVCGPWPTERIDVIGDRPTLDGLAHELVTAFGTATDVALFYYVGHGQFDLHDRLCLTLGGSSTDAILRTTTSLTFEAVRHAFQVSPATTKIAILDCCFAGLAGRDGTLADHQRPLPPTGSYLMMASGEFSTAWYERDPGQERPQTYFTKYLADVIERGIPDQGEGLMLGPIFDATADDLMREGKPEPRRRAVDHASRFIFARNTAIHALQTTPSTPSNRLEPTTPSPPTTAATRTPTRAAEPDQAPRPAQPRRVWLPRTPAQVALVAAALALLTLAAVIMWPQRPPAAVTSLEQVGTTVSYIGRDDPRVTTQVDVSGTTAIFAYLQDLYGPVRLHAIDLRTGNELWRNETTIDTLQWELTVSADLIALEYSLDNGANYFQRYLHMSDGSESATVHSTAPISMIIDGYALTQDNETGISAYDADGDVQYNWSMDELAGDRAWLSSLEIELTGSMDAAPASAAPGDQPQRLWALTGTDFDGFDLMVYNLQSGAELIRGPIDLKGIDSSSGISALAKNDHFLITYTNNNSLTLNVYEIGETIDLVDSEVFNQHYVLTDCGGTLVCLGGTEGPRLYDLATSDLRSFSNDTAMSFVAASANGELLCLHYHDEGGAPYTAVYDPDKNRVGDPIEGWLVAVDDSIAVAYAHSEDDLDSLTDASDDPDQTLRAFDRRTGDTTEIGSAASYGIEFCAASSATLACATTGGLAVFRFREQ